MIRKLILVSVAVLAFIPFFINNHSDIQHNSQSIAISDKQWGGGDGLIASSDKQWGGGAGVIV